MRSIEPCAEKAIGATRDGHHLELLTCTNSLRSRQVTTRKYQQASDHFLTQPGRELAASDLAQASEKGWGAATQILKATAKQRGWEHNRHRRCLSITSRLRAESDDADPKAATVIASAAWQSHRHQPHHLDQPPLATPQLPRPLPLARPGASTLSPTTDSTAGRTGSPPPSR